MRYLLYIGLILVSCLHGNAQNDNLTDAYGLFHAGKYQLSRSAFDKLINAAASPRPVDLLHRGITSYYLGDYPAAADDLRKSAEKGENKALLWLARVQVSAGQNEMAFMALSNYIKSSGGEDYNAIKKDSLFRKLHGSDEWFELWQDENMPEEARIIDQATTLSMAGKHAQAISLLQNFPEGSDNVFVTGSKIYAAAGEFQLAINELNKGLESRPGNFLMLKQKSIYLLNLEKYREAYDILTKLISATPEDFSLHYNLAEAAYNSGNLTTAKDQILLYLNYSEEKKAVFLAGKIEYSSGSYLNSIRYFNQLLETDSSNAGYFKARGMAYYQTNTLSQAAYDLSMSLDLVPDDAESNYFLGLAQERLGNMKLACYYMNRAKKFGEKRSYEFLYDNCGM